MNPEAKFIELNFANHVHAKISTVGAALKSLSVNSINIITPTVGHELNKFADGLVLAPWANRIEDGKWNLNGQLLQLPINDQESHNSIHGLVAQAIFEVEQQDENWVLLSTVIKPTDGYPFEIYIGVRYQLTSTGITVKHTAKNLGEASAPLVIGAHPYFQIGDIPIEELELRSSARAVILVNERKIPIGRQATAGTHFDITNWRKLSTCDFDHGFADLERDAEGVARHYLRGSKDSSSRSKATLEIWQSAELKHVFIFTPDFYFNNLDSTKRHAIAIEPQSAPANAFNSKEDLTWLEPGEVFSCSWGASLN